jgi:hypothetical protein
LGRSRKLFGVAGLASAQLFGVAGLASAQLFGVAGLASAQLFGEAGLASAQLFGEAGSTVLVTTDIVVSAMEAVSHKKAQTTQKEPLITLISRI